MNHMRRTTISIDDELHARVERVATQRGCSFSAALSQILRLGFGDGQATPYELPTFDAGRALIEDLDDVAGVLDRLDDAAAR